MTDLKCNWRIPINSLDLASNDVHVWRAKLDPSEECTKQLTRMLSDDEQKKMRRFHYDKDRKRFIVTRGVLRKIMSRYLNIKPSHIQFGYSTHGKPYLVEKLRGEKICFNLSYSHNLSLYAFTKSRRVGIDIEYVRPFVDVDQIVAGFFSSNEQAIWQQLPEKQKQEAFFNCWTRKEAYIKARGEGLSLPLDQFEVSFAPGKPAALLGTDGALDQTSRWLLRVIQSDSSYAAALVVEGCDWQLKCWEWSF